MDSSIVFARLWQCASYLTHASLDPPESTSQMTSRSVQPFLHSWWQRASILHNGPQNCHFACGYLTLFHTRHLDWFSGFCRAHDSDRQTDRHATLSVTIGRMWLKIKKFPNKKMGKRQTLEIFYKSCAQLVRSKALQNVVLYVVLSFAR